MACGSQIFRSRPYRPSDTPSLKLNAYLFPLQSLKHGFSLALNLRHDKKKIGKEALLIIESKILTQNFSNLLINHVQHPVDSEVLLILRKKLLLSIQIIF
jgi:hypothetical protein